MNRVEFKLITRFAYSSKSLINQLQRLFVRDITLKQFYLELVFRFYSNSKMQNDDFNWARYHTYYSEELKSISRKHTLILDSSNFLINEGKIQLISPFSLPLHENHKLLYETVLKLGPDKVLEVGCGGGDHIYNISLLIPKAQIAGLDRSIHQLEIASSRHPNLLGKLTLCDLTGNELPDLVSTVVFSQAVLMHISEDHERFQTALRNMFRLSEKHVLLMENWTQHDFLTQIQKILEVDEEWSGAYLYFTKSLTNSFTSILIVSKTPLEDFQELINYDQLLEGRKLITH